MKPLWYRCPACKRRIPWLRALLLLSILVACGRSAAPPAEIRLGVIASFSGPGQIPGWRSLRRGAELAAKDVNRGGGLEVAGKRRRVRLLFADDGGYPEAAVEAARKLINQDDVAALVGPGLSRCALAVAGIAENQGVPMISPTATHPELTAGRSYVFRVPFSDDLQGRAIARFARADLGAGRAAVLYDVASAYNRGLAEIFHRELEALGGRVVAFESYTTGQTDFRAALGRIRESAPEILFLPNYFDTVLRQAAQARELGIDAVLLGGDSWEGSDYRALPVFAGSFFAAGWHPEIAHPESLAFLDAYRRRYRSEPFNAGALAYDALGLLFHAVTSQGSFEGVAIRRGLEVVDGYRGVTGSISYRGRREPLRDVLILRVGIDGVSVERQIGP